MTECHVSDAPVKMKILHSVLVVFTLSVVIKTEGQSSLLFQSLLPQDFERLTNDVNDKKSTVHRLLTGFKPTTYIDVFNRLFFTALDHCLRIDFEELEKDLIGEQIEPAPTAKKFPETFLIPTEVLANIAKQASCMTPSYIETESCKKSLIGTESYKFKIGSDTLLFTIAQHVTSDSSFVSVNIGHLNSYESALDWGSTIAEYTKVVEKFHTVADKFLLDFQTPFMNSSIFKQNFGKSKIIFSGHGSGGTIALLMACKMLPIQVKDVVNLNGSKNQMNMFGAITIGSPRVFSAEMASNFPLGHLNHINFTSQQDLFASPVGFHYLSQTGVPFELNWKDMLLEFAQSFKIGDLTNLVKNLSKEDFFASMKSISNVNVDTLKTIAKTVLGNFGVSTLTAAEVLFNVVTTILHDPTSYLKLLIEHFRNRRSESPLTVVTEAALSLERIISDLEPEKRLIVKCTENTSKPIEVTGQVKKLAVTCVLSTKQVPRIAEFDYDVFLALDKKITPEILHSTCISKPLSPQLVSNFNTCMKAIGEAKVREIAGRGIDLFIPVNNCVVAEDPKRKLQVIVRNNTAYEALKKVYQADSAMFYRIVAPDEVPFPEFCSELAPAGFKLSSSSRGLEAQVAAFLKEIITGTDGKCDPMRIFTPVDIKGFKILQQKGSLTADINDTKIKESICESLTKSLNCFDQKEETLYHECKSASHKWNHEWCPRTCAKEDSFLCERIKRCGSDTSPFLIGFRGDSLSGRSKEFSLYNPTSQIKSSEGEILDKEIFMSAAFHLQANKGFGFLGSRKSFFVVLYAKKSLEVLKIEIENAKKTSGNSSAGSQQSSGLNGDNGCDNTGNDSEKISGCVLKLNELKGFKWIEHVTPDAFAKIHTKISDLPPSEFSRINGKQIDALPEFAESDGTHGCNALKRNEFNLSPEALASYKTKCGGGKSIKAKNSSEKIARTLILTLLSTLFCLIFH